MDTTLIAPYPQAQKNFWGLEVKSKCLAACLSVLALLSPCVKAVEPSIQAVTFKHADGREAPAEVYVDGELTPALPRQLASALATNHIERATIYLNSIGGDLQAGMELGEFIRRSGFNTAIGRRGSAYGQPVAGSCQSACLMTFAGGVYRFADPNTFFGIHRFYSRSVTTQDLALAQVISAAITGYLMRMGVSPELFERMANAGATPQKLPVAQAQKLNLVNNGVLPASWVILGQRGRVFLQGEQKTWNGSGKIQLSCSRSEGMTLTAQYDADRNTAKIQADAKHMSLRVDGSFIGISPDAFLQKPTVDQGYLTTSLKVSRSVAQELSQARSIGFAWLPAETSIFYGFDLAVGDNHEALYSFIRHCSDRLPER